MAVLHLAQHIEREEVFVDRGGNNLIQWLWERFYIQ
jgi:hypothetical protein